MLWRPHHLIRAHTKFDFLGKRKIALAVSTAINVLSLVGALVFGLNFGIDFEGGIAVQVRAKQGTVHLDELRSTLGALGVGEVSLQEFGDASTALIRVQRQEGNAQCVANAERVMKRRAGDGWTVKPGPDSTGDVVFTAPGALDAANWRDAVSRVGLTVQERQLPRGNTNIARIDMTPDQRAEWCQQVAIKLVEDTIGDKYELRGTESVGPKIGAELMHSGVIAVLATLAAIAIYVWFRFEWQFGVGALMALLHDVISTLGLFVLLRLDFSLTALAALLTIAGYSINDTVVIFDRVRENMRRYKKMPLIDLLNLSINETLARTLMTSGTVFVAVLALVLFGGPVLYSFSVAMLWGVIVGTYSSIWIASACLVYLKLRPEQLQDQRGEGREGQGVIPPRQGGPLDKTLPTPDPSQVQLIRSYGPGHFLIGERDWRSPVLVTPTVTTVWNVTRAEELVARQSGAAHQRGRADRIAGAGLRPARRLHPARQARRAQGRGHGAGGGRHRLGLPHLQRAAGRGPARGGGAGAALTQISSPSRTP